jgi:hypothetical protein
MTKEFHFKSHKYTRQMAVTVQRETGMPDDLWTVTDIWYDQFMGMASGWEYQVNRVAETQYYVCACAPDPDW